MRRHRLALPAVAIALAAAAAVPAGASAASWGPAYDATKAGRAFQPSAAAADDRFAVGFTRELGDARRAELRRGTLGDRLRGGSTLLDTTAGNLDSVTVALTGDDGTAAAWRRSANRAQRLRGATISGKAEPSGRFDLTADGTESAYDPRWVTVPGGTPLLAWDRRRSSAVAPLEGDRFGAPSALPGTGVGSQVSVAVAPDGTRVAVWRDGTRVVAATVPSGGAFGTPAPLSGPGVARDPQLVIGADGTAVAAWVRNAGAGNVLEVATRPSGGAFGAPVVLSDPSEGAFSPRPAASSAGGFVVAWVGAATARGWGGASGALRARLLGADGTPAGTTLTLAPTDARVVVPTITGDGRGGVLVGWRTGTRDGRRIVVRRIATSTGVVGIPRVLGGGPSTEAAAPVLAGAGGRAVAVWIAGNVVRYRVYR